MRRYIFSGRPRWRQWAVLLTITAAATGGCGSSRPDTAADGAAAAPAVDTSYGALEPGDTWEAIFMHNERVGYAHTEVVPLEGQSESLMQIEIDNHMTVVRAGQPIEVQLRLKSIETPAGKLRRYETEFIQGSEPQRTRGTIEGDRLVVESTTGGGRTETFDLTWDIEAGGLMAIEQSLRGDPLEPGESRRLKVFEPSLNVVIDTDLMGGAYESTELIDESAELLHIDATNHLPGGLTLESIMWTDRQGRTYKMATPAIGETRYRTTRDVATADVAPPNFDLFTDSIVKIDGRLERPHETRRIRYRVTLADDNPARVFVAGNTQQVRSIDENTAEIEVRSIRPGEAAEGAVSAAATEADLRPNSMIQSDDEKIIQMAVEAAAGASGDAPVAIALERYVHGLITRKNFSQAFATAAEVAVVREGDCTEHAVLLAALARARGIPARVAIGLLYTGVGYGYHMWNELYLDGHWVPMDAMLGQGGIGAAHLKLADSTLEGASAYAAFLPVAKVMGRLRIEIVEVEYE